MHALVPFAESVGENALVCVPWAGAGAAPFHGWAQQAGRDVSVVGVRLPGRESRISEGPATRIEDVVDVLAAEIAASIDKPLTLFGQCSGALVAFEVARRLTDTGYPSLQHLVVGSHEAPSHKRSSDLTGDVWSQLDSFGVESAALPADPELRELLRPALEADVQLALSYSYTGDQQLSVPVTVVIGSEDNEVDRTRIEAWQRETSGPLRVMVAPGDHLFSGAAWSGLASIVTTIAACKSLEDVAPDE